MPAEFPSSMIWTGTRVKPLTNPQASSRSLVREVRSSSYSNRRFKLRTRQLQSRTMKAPGTGHLSPVLSRSGSLELQKVQRKETRSTASSVSHQGYPRPSRGQRTCGPSLSNHYLRTTPLLDRVNQELPYFGVRRCPSANEALREDSLKSRIAVKVRRTLKDFWTWVYLRPPST
ncbi:uncharacterized protein BDV14DRAFT_171455 [Aspergillus stella-maris]|uniref:uncharacterized protein n=1 Tax=Aspergillus stella-maris TaxID=1810926 RepID=UPI003CCCD64C